MSTPATDRIVADARIGPHDSPHEAATHVWTQVVSRHDVPSDGALGRVGVLERVVLVLGDVVGLTPQTIADVLNTDEATIRATRAAAGERLGLPSLTRHPCDAWADERAHHPPGDPAVLEGLLAHTARCDQCTAAVDTDRARLHQRLAQRATGPATHRPAVSAALGSLGTTAAAAAVIAVGVAVGAAVAPMPSPPRLVPVVVDASPALPSDEEPPAGWPAPPADTTSSDPRSEKPGDGVEEPAGRADDASADRPAPEDEVEEPTEQELTDAVDETIDDVGDTIDDVGDTIDDVSGTVDDLDDTVDDATDTTRETLDDATDTLDGTSDTLRERTEEAADGLTDTTEGLTDQLPVP